MIAIEAGLWERMVLVMRVETRQVKASDAARQMGVSRKTFYQLALRGRMGMAAAMTPRPAGRPGQLRNPQLEYLLSENTRLQRENRELQQTLRIRELLHRPTVDHAQSNKKKAGRGGRGH
jgi:transposase